MPKFVTEVDKCPKLVVELKQDDDDVNILVNGVVVGYFRGLTGKLALMTCCSDEQESVTGLVFDDNRCVAVE